MARRSKGLKLGEGVDAAVGSIFGPADRKFAEALLDSFINNEELLFSDLLSSSDVERILCSVLRVSKGSVEGLCEALEMAAEDWAELLVLAGFHKSRIAHREWLKQIKSGSKTTSGGVA